jgi:hypothetical protein
MNKVDKIGRHIFYKKRNEEPYLVEASASEAPAAAAAEGTPNVTADASSSLTLTPTLSLVSAVVAGSSTPPTQAMSLGYAPHE